MKKKLRELVERERAKFRASPHPPPNVEALNEMVRWSEENGFYDEPDDAAAPPNTPAEPK